MVRRALSLSIFALAAVAVSQQPVTYRTVAKSTSQVLEDLSKKSGRHLRATASIAKLTIVVDVKERPLDELLDRIAQTTLGKWEKKSGEEWLAPDPQARKRREQEFLALQERTIREGIVQSEEHGALDPIPDTLKEVERLESRGRRVWPPVDRLALRLLKDLPAGSLTTNRPIPELVFSTHPNQIRRPFPRNISGHIATFRAESQKFASLYPDDDVLRPARIDLRLMDPTELSGAFYIAIRSEQGQWTQSSVFLNSFASLMPEVPAGLPSKFTPEMKLVRSKRTRSMPSGRFRPIRVVDPEIMESLLKPEEYDPLSTYVSDFWLQVSDVTKQNLVVCPSDRLWAYDDYYTQQVGALRKASRFLWEPTTRSDGTWITCWPISEMPGRRQVDRAAVGKFLRQRARLGYDTLEARAALAAAVDTQTDMHGILAYADQVVPSAAPTVQFDWPQLRLIGSLTDVQRGEFLAGKPISVTSLTGSALADMLLELGNHGLDEADLSRAAVRAKSAQAVAFWTLRSVKDYIASIESVDPSILAAELQGSNYASPVAWHSWPDTAQLQLSPLQRLTILVDFGDTSLDLGSGRIQSPPDRNKWFTVKTLPREAAELIARAREKLPKNDGGTY